MRLSDRRATIRIVHDVATPWDVNRDTWQAIVNAHPIPARRAQANAAIPIPVTARIIWERDGVEELKTVAWGWTTRLAQIEVIDPRWQTIGVWLSACDVRRRVSTSVGLPGRGVGALFAVQNRVTREDRELPPWR